MKRVKTITVFTDGASRGNPGPGGWGVLIASDLNVYELAGAQPNTTNNRMELTAVMTALQFLRDHGQATESVTIHTDSQYVKNGFERWMFGWQKNNWLTSKKEPVLNQDLWQELLDLAPLFPKLTLRHVRGHVGIPANERVDELATSAADGTGFNLYRGSRDKYLVDLTLSSAQTSNKKTTSKKRSGRALCYLSLVDGQLMEHANWAECQARVTGKPGAKYRRADTEIEKREILDSWGV